MARRWSKWDFTALPDGRVLQDPAWAGGLRAGDPRGRWLGCGFEGQTYRSLGVFLAVFVAYVVVAWPYLFHALEVVGIGLGLAYGAAWLASRSGALALFDDIGGAWLYLPDAALAKDAAIARIDAVMDASGFTKVGRHIDIVNRTVTNMPYVPPTVTMIPTHDSLWYGDDVVELQLHCTGGTRLSNNPSGADRPDAIYLETHGDGKVDLHRRLKGQLLYAFIEASMLEAEPFDPLKTAKEATVPPATG